MSTEDLEAIRLRLINRYQELCLLDESEEDVCRRNYILVQLTIIEEELMKIERKLKRKAVL